jgi:Dolichyl-phosphate-mannose-protein mannosyltransferase
MRKPWDRASTLAAIYLLYAVANISLQHRIWYFVAADKPIGVMNQCEVFLGALAVLLLCAWLAPAASEALLAKTAASLRHRRRTLMWLVLVLAAPAAATVAYEVLDRFQNSGDEFAYFFQAEQFAAGRLWAAAPPLGDTFVPYRTWVIGNKWLSQYPPGWPLALAGALRAGIPAWAVNAVIGTGGAAALLSPLWRFEDRRAVAAVVVLYLMTPFYLLNAASFHSHILSAGLVLMLCLCCLWYQHDRRNVALLGAGLVIALIGLTRYYSAPLLIPALTYWLFIENRARRVRMVVMLALGALPLLLLLMAYQYLVTGSALRSTYFLITNEDVFVTFSLKALADGALLSMIRLEELSLWTYPLVVPVYAFCLASKLKARSFAFYDLIFPTFVIGYIFFADLGGNRYGPRYFFDAFPAMVATIISAAPQAGAWARQLCNRPLVMHAAGVAAVYLMTTLPFAMTAYHRQIRSREEPYRIAASMGLKQAVVVIESSSGRNLMAEDLARNESDLKAPVLYARAGVTVGDLRASFPDRSIWTYRRDDLNKAGRVDAVAASQSGDTRLETVLPGQVTP